MVKSEQVKEVAHLFSCVGHFLNAGAFGVYFALKKKGVNRQRIVSLLTCVAFFFSFEVRLTSSSSFSDVTNALVVAL